QSSAERGRSGRAAGARQAPCPARKAAKALAPRSPHDRGCPAAGRNVRFPDARRTIRTLRMVAGDCKLALFDDDEVGGELAQRVQAALLPMVLLVRQQSHRNARIELLHLS